VRRARRRLAVSRNFRLNNFHPSFASPQNSRGNTHRAVAAGYRLSLLNAIKQMTRADDKIAARRKNDLHFKKL
jgi:hypothetical protein